jgi:SNF2 family DNA or RNA helicase
MDVGPPWANQQSASDWMDGRRFGYFGHEMGCGKSRSTLMALRNCRTILIVCPIAVGPAWQKQMRLYSPGWRCVVAVKGTAAARAQKISDALADEVPTAIVINYDSVWRGSVGKAVQAVAWDAIVLDEAHRIKSPTGKATKWLSRLAASKPNAKRICLSGTPTPNTPLDWWGQFLFLDPTILGSSFSTFRSRIAITHPRYPGWVTGFKQDALQSLRARLDEHVHRVTAAEVLTLPDSLHEVIDVTLGAKTRKFYRGLEDQMIARLSETEVVTAANQLVVVGRLQAATSGFARADGDDHFTAIDGIPDKRLAVREFLTDFPVGEPLVVFVKFIEDLKHVEEECRLQGRSTSVLCGSRKELESWQAGETDVLVVQQQCGGAGVDLTRACYCIYYSISHSLGDYEQSLARLLRPGQTRCVRYYHVVAKDTVDEQIYSAIANKRDIVESILENLTRRVHA